MGVYLSFLVRLWCEDKPRGVPPTVTWKAQIEHIQSGRCWWFASLDEMLAFLRQQVEDAGFPQVPEV